MFVRTVYQEFVSENTSTRRNTRSRERGRSQREKCCRKASAMNTDCGERREGDEGYFFPVSVVPHTSWMILSVSDKSIPPGEKEKEKEISTSDKRLEQLLLNTQLLVRSYLGNFTLTSCRN